MIAGGEVRVHHRHRDVVVPQKLLQRDQVSAGHDVVRRESVTKRVPWMRSDGTAGLLKESLKLLPITAVAHS